MKNRKKKKALKNNLFTKRLDKNKKKEDRKKLKPVKITKTSTSKFFEVIIEDSLESTLKTAEKEKELEHLSEFIPLRPGKAHSTVLEQTEHISHIRGLQVTRRTSNLDKQDEPISYEGGSDSGEEIAYKNVGLDYRENIVYSRRDFTSATEVETEERTPGDLRTISARSHNPLEISNTENNSGIAKGARDPSLRGGYQGAYEIERANKKSISKAEERKYKIRK